MITFQGRHCIILYLLIWFSKVYMETLYGNKYVWFIIVWYPDNWYCHLRFPSSLSTILHQDPRLTEVGMVVSRVEGDGILKD